MRVFFEARGAYAVDDAQTEESAWPRLADAAYDVAIVDCFLPDDGVRDGNVA